MMKDKDIKQFQSFVHAELKDLKDCMKTINESLKKNGRTHILIKELKGEKVDLIGELLGNTDFSKIISTFPEILQLSFFITFYAFFENTLTGLCEIIRGKRNYRLKISDIRDRGIIAAQTYIKKLAKLPFPDQSPCWNDIRTYGDIRNCIVHRGGQITDGDKKLKGKIKKFTERGFSVDLTLGKRIHPFEGFCLKFVNIMEDFLEELFKGITNEINKA